MIDLLAITNSPGTAQRLDAITGMRLFVDLERNGKAERQAGRNTFISAHSVEDIGRVKAVLKQAKLMVRINPYQADDEAACRAEIDAVLAQDADMLMLPMFKNATELQAFARLVDGRVPIVALLETSGALESLHDWIDTPGLFELFVGLNDLHLSLGCRFMFEPLALGHVDRVAQAAKARGLRFGFGGIARLDEGALPGRNVLAEHVRLGSGAVILSRTFFSTDTLDSAEKAIDELRSCESALAERSRIEMSQDQARVAALIHRVADGMGAAQ
jgi:hypothetical protein